MCKLQMEKVKNRETQKKIGNLNFRAILFTLRYRYKTAQINMPKIPIRFFSSQTNQSVIYGAKIIHNNHEKN